MHKVMIIAECGHNWNYSDNRKDNMEMARDLIRLAKEFGADYAKFQLYDTDQIKKPGDTNYKELKEAELTKEELFELAKFAKFINMPFMCSVFDLNRLNWYAELKNNNINLTYTKFGMRMQNNKDIELLLDFSKTLDLKNIVSCSKIEGTYDSNKNISHILYCISRRDILRNGIGLKDIPNFKQSGFDGFSDHTIGLEYAKYAIDRGAKIIEKHFTFDKNLKGWDQPASMTPCELEELRIYAEKFA